jgi:hypothetical protein
MGNRDYALKLMNQAITAVNDKSKPSNITTAYQLFASACIADPTFGETFYQYGNNNFDLKRYPSAIAAYRRALNCDLSRETKAKTLLNLAWCQHLLGNTSEAYEIGLKAYKVQPDLTFYWIHLSVLEGLRGNSDASVEAAERAVEFATLELSEAKDDAQAFAKSQLLEARIVLAFALLFNGQYKRGFELFELRFEWRLHHFLQFPYERWQGEPDKTVFLAADQGLGDTLSFARFVQAACKRAKYVHAYVQSPLMRVFLHSLGHIPNLNLIPFGNAYPEADYWTTFVSLPFALGLSDAEVREAKQIEPPVYRLPTTWMVPDTKLHIGIAWAGSPLNDIDQHRNIPVTQFLDLYKVPGIQLYGLQIGERNQELHESGAVSLIRDLSTYINDVADTVSILQNLDLVICCESALGHICALAGKECWVPYSWQGRDYRLGLLGEKKMWTPKHRVFRQMEGYSWSDVFDNIVVALKEKVSEHGVVGRKITQGSKVARSRQRVSG